MADNGTTILNLPATVALNDTDVIPLARPSGTTAPGSDLGLTGAALKALFGAGGPATSKGGVFRGSFAANAVYGQYDGIIIPAGAPSAGLFAFATVAFTAAAAYSPANWTLDPGQSTNDYTTTEKAKLATLTPAAPLYARSGTATDGPMTQAATTAALAAIPIRLAGSPNSLIAGATQNSIDPTALECAIIGGNANAIRNTSHDSGIIAGANVIINTVPATAGVNGADSAALVGAAGSVGGLFIAIGVACAATVGGLYNTVNGYASAIIAGVSNTLPLGAYRSAIVGGKGFTAPAQADTLYTPQAYLFAPGGGLSLLSPDGLTRRVLTIDNAGNLVVSATGTPPAAPTVSNASFTAA